VSNPLVRLKQQCIKAVNQPLLSAFELLDFAAKFLDFGIWHEASAFYGFWQSGRRAEWFADRNARLADSV
jgi:hypothetical protein